MVTQQKEEVSRQELKDLIDDLPNFELHALKRYVQFLRYADDPLGRTLAEVTLDDEPVTDEDIAAFTETDQYFRTGNVFTQEEIEKDLGL